MTILARSTVFGTLLLLAGCSGAVGPSVPDPPPPPDDDPPGYFTDMTEASNLHFTYRNGQEGGSFAILESLGGGVGLIDYDKDGLLDVFLTGGGAFDGKAVTGLPNRLFRNEGNWRFREVTAEVGLPAEGPFYSHGVAVADYDVDGWPDLLVTGYGRLALYHNEPLTPNPSPPRGEGSKEPPSPLGGEGQGVRGSRRFVEVTAKAGLLDKRDVHWSTSAAWGDLDGDGRPDLFVAHYVNWSPSNNPDCPGYRPGVARDICSPKVFQGLTAALFLNNGDGTFRDGSKEAGLKAGKGLGVVLADLDDDGRLDIYVANDTNDNFLYLNQGQGRFVEAAAARGVAYDDYGVPNGSMGVDVADYNGSGRLSLFVTNYQNEAHALYRNLGKGQFQFASQQAGIAAIGFTYVGFGTGFLDFDRDGSEDLVIANGHVVREPQDPKTLRQRPVLLLNRRGPPEKPFAVTFKNVTDEGGPYFRQQHPGRGLALGDLDNDGRTDLVIGHVNEPVRLLRNTLDNGNAWLGVALTGQGNRDAVGARLTLEAGSRTLVRVIKGGGSYLSAGDTRVAFGLGPDHADKVTSNRLTVRWPSGKVELWSGLKPGRYSHLHEGSGTTAPGSGRPAENSK